MFFIMKQRTRYKNFGNIHIGYWSMNGRYIGIDIGPQKNYRLISNYYIMI